MHDLGDFTVSLGSGQPVVCAPPRIDFRNIVPFHTAVLTASLRGPAVADLTETVQCDNTAASALCWVASWLHVTGSGLRIAWPSKSLPWTEQIAGHQVLIRRQLRLPHLPVSRRDGVWIVTMPREMDVANAGQLYHALMTAAIRGPVVADMTATRFCDSTSLLPAALTSQWLRRQGSTLRVVCPDAHQRRIMTFVQDDRRYQILDAMPPALRSQPPQNRKTIAAAA